MRALIYILSLVCAGTVLAQPNWDYSITDKSHNILIPADIDGGSFEMGDYIGVFYEENGELFCAGYSEYTEGNIVLTAFGASFSYSGFTVGQAFHFIHWSATNQIQNEIYAVYNSIDFPNGEQFVVDGLSGISSFSLEYIPGCTNDEYFEYNPIALQDDGTCLTLWSDEYLTLSYNLDSVQNSFDDVLLQLEISNTQLDSLQNEYEILETDLDSANSTVTDLTSNLASTYDSIYDLEEELYNTQDQLINSQSTLSNTQVVLENTINTLSNTQFYSDSIYSELVTTQINFDNLTIQYNFLQNHFSESILSIDSIQLVYDSLLIEYNNIYISNISEVFIPLLLPEGWSMFGYTCLESISIEDGFAGFLDKIILLKDYNGECCIPEYGYDGVGDLEFSRGYKIKLSEEITDFYFCPVIVVE